MKDKILENILKAYNKQVEFAHDPYEVHMAAINVLFLADDGPREHLFNKDIMKKDFERLGPKNRLALFELIFERLMRCPDNNDPSYIKASLADFVRETRVQILRPKEVRELLFSCVFDPKLSERANVFIIEYEKAFKYIAHVYAVYCATIDRMASDLSLEIKKNKVIGPKDLIDEIKQLKKNKRKK